MTQLFHPRNHWHLETLVLEMALSINTLNFPVKATDLEKVKP